MKSGFLTIFSFVLFFAAQSSIAQENFQRYYAQVQSVLSKTVETLDNDDVQLLNRTIALDANIFGEANNRLVSKMIQDSKAKKSEYEQYLKAKDDLQRTKEDLGATTEAWKQSELRGDSLFMENTQLREFITQLTNRIVKLEAESKKLQNVNKQIQQENIQIKDMLESGRSAIKRILALMPNEPQLNELNEQIPSTLQDSLNNSECKVAELLRTNYLLSLQTMMRDVMFMDSARNYFSENLIHLQIIDNYIAEGLDLVARLKGRGADCTNSYAAEIELGISDFKSRIETSDASTSSSFSRFFSENSSIIILLFIIILVLLVFLFIKSRK